VATWFILAVQAVAALLLLPLLAEGPPLTIHK
jgi:hypothetical protein